MSPTYEYIVAILITILMLGYTYYSVTTLSSNQLQLVEEEQLDVVASRLFDKILLTKGYPEDWGSNIKVNNTSLQDFGLSLSHGKLYDLDVDKVMRMFPGASEIVNPMYINATTFGTLTGLYDAEKGYWKYGFRFYLKTALNVTIEKADTKPITEKFKVSVKNFMGKNAPNAEVKGTYIAIYVVKQGNDQYMDYSYTIVNNMTDWMGETLLDFRNNMPQTPKQGVSGYAYCLVVTVNYYGLQSQQSYVTNTIPTLGLIVQGKYLIANFTQEDIARGAYHVELTAFAITSSLTMVLDPAINVTNGEAGKVVNYGGKSYRVYELKNVPSQDVIFVGLLVKKGEWGIVFASRPRTPVAVDYTSMGLTSSGINTVTLSRIVRIGTNSYYAELTLWRMSE